MRRDARASAETKSSRTDMVSDADRASERLIVERILAARPDDAFLGEESGEHAGTSGVRWVIDPLDGTTNYLYRVPFYAVSIGVEVGDATCVAAVFAPEMDELFTAVAGYGAWMNGERIACSEQLDLDTALVDTGFDYTADRRALQGLVVADVLPRVRDIRRYGAASLDLCWVACGRADAYYERGLGGAWDMAAGELIAREAGAVTSSIDGGAPSPASMLAAAPGIYYALAEVLQGAERW
jgi:myo-inositol-1(or 4)-monophosphatase